MNNERRREGKDKEIHDSDTKNVRVVCQPLQHIPNIERGREKESERERNKREKREGERRRCEREREREREREKGRGRKTN